MQGGLVSKGFDLISSPQYMAAGAIDALTAGQNPFEGMAKGLANRTTYGKVLEHHGMTGALAKTAGVIADIVLDPTWLLAAPIAGAAKASSLARLTGKGVAAVAEKLPSVKTFLNDVSLADGLGAAMHAGDSAIQLAAMEKVAARDAYKTTLIKMSGINDAKLVEQAATEAGRRAAVLTRRQLTQGLAGGWAQVSHGERMTRIGHAMAMRDIGLQTAHGAADTGVWAGLYKTFVNTTARALGDAGRYTPQGEVIASLMGKRGNLEQQLRGAYLSHAQTAILPLIKKLGAEDVAALGAHLNGLHPLNLADPSLGPDLRNVLTVIRESQTTIGKDIADLGIEAVHMQGTAALANVAAPHLPVVGEIFRELAAGNHNAIPVLMQQLPEEAQKQVSRALNLLNQSNSQWKHVRMEIVDHPGASGVPVLVTVASENMVKFFPVLNQVGRKTMIDAGKQGKARELLIESMRKANPGVPEHALVNSLEVLVGKGDTPVGDLRRMLHSDIGWLIDHHPEWIETDPTKILEHMYAGASTTLAHAAVFGGDMAVEKGLMAGARTAARGNKTAEAGVAEMQRILDASKGIYGDGAGLDKVVRYINNITSGVMLGPRTSVLQFMQASNPIAAFGFTNTAAAAREVLTNPAARERVLRVGGLDPVRRIMAEGGIDTGSIAGGIIKMSGIPAADEHMRVLSGIAGGLKAQELVEKAAKIGVVRLQSPMGKQLMKDAEAFGIHLPEVLMQGGGRLTDAQLDKAIMRAANMTQFTGRVEALPMSMNSLGGRFFLRFKAFTMQQAEFLGSQIIDPIKAGQIHTGLGRAARYALAYGVTYDRLSPLLERMKMTPTPEQEDLATLKKMLMTGAMGLWGDSAMTLMSGDQRQAESLLAGPNVSLLANAINTPIGYVKRGAETGEWNPMKGPLRPMIPSIVKQPLAMVMKDD